MSCFGTIPGQTASTSFYERHVLTKLAAVHNTLPDNLIGWIGNTFLPFPILLPFFYVVKSKYIFVYKPFSECISVSTEAEVILIHGNQIIKKGNGNNCIKLTELLLQNMNCFITYSLWSRTIDDNAEELPQELQQQALLHTQFILDCACTMVKVYKIDQKHVRKNIF